MNENLSYNSSSPNSEGRHSKRDVIKGCGINETVPLLIFAFSVVTLPFDLQRAREFTDFNLFRLQGSKLWSLK
jgi:hypothetical protein